MVTATRRKFFSFVGATPLAAKSALDKNIGQAIGLPAIPGLGTTAGAPSAQGYSDDWTARAIGASNYVKIAGLPAVIEAEIRENARSVYYLDPDIACKRSWSMSVKIMTQRQRNYDRTVERIHRNGWMIPARTALQKMLGFEWPWN
jgi:hypothetical protein